MPVKIQFALVHRCCVAEWNESIFLKLCFVPNGLTGWQRINQ